jgi:membrane-associated phospholipid phosphatase
VKNTPSHPKSNKVTSKSRRGWVYTRWHAAREWIASERLRRIRTYIFQGYILLALIAFAGLAFLANTVPIFPPDVSITRNLQEEMPSWLGMVMQWVSWPGFGIQSGIIIAAAAGILAVIGLRWEAVMALLTGIGTGALNTLVKVVVHRPRPGADLVNVVQTLNSYSFPSGHVMFYTGFFGFLLFLSFTLLKRTGLRYLVNTVLIILIALVGVSRMYLGEHWASDVLGGYLLGSLVLIVAVMLYRWGKERFFTRQPVAADTARTSMTADENKEIKEALKNPLLMQKEQAKQEAKQEAKVSGEDQQTKNPKS